MKLEQLRHLDDGDCRDYFIKLWNLLEFPQTARNITKI